MSTTSTERYYTAKETSDEFNISGSTLRKWCLSLEKHGYEFTRGEQNRRLFSEKDLESLKYFQELIQVKNMSLENASIIISSRFKESRSSTGTPSVRAESVQNNEDSPTLEKLTEYIQQQERFNQELLKRLDEQSEYINNRLDQRDNALMETMNKLHEQRKKEMKLLEERKKENWLTKIFKK